MMEMEEFLVLVHVKILGKMKREQPCSNLHSRRKENWKTNFWMMQQPLQCK